MWSGNAPKFMDNIEGFYKEEYKIKEDMQLLSSNLAYCHSEWNKLQQVRTCVLSTLGGFFILSQDNFLGEEKFFSARSCNYILEWCLGLLVLWC